MDCIALDTPYMFSRKMTSQCVIYHLSFWNYIGQRIQIGPQPTISADIQYSILPSFTKVAIMSWVQ